jgi:hypothetical protein
MENSHRRGLLNANPLGRSSVKIERAQKAYGGEASPVLVIICRWLLNSCSGFPQTVAVLLPAFPGQPARHLGRGSQVAVGAVNEGAGGYVTRLLSGASRTTQRMRPLRTVARRDDGRAGGGASPSTIRSNASSATEGRYSHPACAHTLRRIPASADSVCAPTRRNLNTWPPTHLCEPHPWLTTRLPPCRPSAFGDTPAVHGAPRRPRPQRIAL